MTEREKAFMLWGVAATIGNDLIPKGLDPDEFVESLQEGFNLSDDLMEAVGYEASTLLLTYTMDMLAERLNEKSE